MPNEAKIKRAIYTKLGAYVPIDEIIFFEPDYVKDRSGTIWTISEEEYCYLCEYFGVNPE
jgi:hypothetical protein